MFTQFVTALVQKVFSFLSANPDFFAKALTERERLIEDLSIPSAFKGYLIIPEKSQFINDLPNIIKFSHNSKDKSIAKSPFFKAFLHFLTTDLARKIDFLDSNYYLMQKSKRVEVVEKLIKGDTLLAQALKNILINFSYQQIADNINNIGHIVAKTPFIVVQSPREIGAELKREIRESLYEKHPLSFPVFQINKKLIGGIRIFKNGTTQDQSWLSRVLRFTSLTSA